MQRHWVTRAALFIVTATAALGCPRVSAMPLNDGIYSKLYTCYNNAAQEVASLNLAGDRTYVITSDDETLSGAGEWDIDGSGQTLSWMSGTLTRFGTSQFSSDNDGELIALVARRERLSCYWANR